MPERRRHPRYPIKLRVYFLEEGVTGTMENVSLDGCYIKADAEITEGVVKDMLVEIPIVGVIALKGYVQHTRKDEEKKGMGIQLVKVRFDSDQEIYYQFFTRFIECLKELDALHEKYLDLALQGKVKLWTFPEEANND